MTASRVVSADRPSPPTRLVDLIVDPRAAFRGIAERPPWALAFCAVIGLRFVSLLTFYQPALTPVKLVAGVLFQIATVAPMLLAVTTVGWLAAKAWRVDVTWQTVFSVSTHVCVAHTLATIALASVSGVLLPDSVDVDLRRPPFSNLAHLVANERSVTGRLLAEIDVRSGYALALAWLGARAAAPEKARSRAAMVIVTGFALRLLMVAMGAARQ